MTELIRRDPARDVGRLRSEMDRLLEDALKAWPFNAREEGYPRIDIYSDENKYEVLADLPGVNSDDVEINVTANQVSIRGEVKKEDERQDGHAYWMERYNGQFVRSFELPTPIQSEKVEANFEDGVLKIELPKAEEARPKSIKVNKKGK